VAPGVVAALEGRPERLGPAPPGRVGEHDARLAGRRLGVVERDAAQHLDVRRLEVAVREDDAPDWIVIRPAKPSVKLVTP
jgi:hypothetical protein